MKVIAWVWLQHTKEERQAVLEYAAWENSKRWKGGERA